MTIVRILNVGLALGVSGPRGAKFGRDLINISGLRYCSAMTKSAFVEERFEKIVKSAEDKRDYRCLILKNRLKVYLVSDPTTDKSAAAMDVNIGWMSDPDDYPGLAHFCEHMLFLGTEKYPQENEYQKFLQENGGFSNACTSNDHTTYYFDVVPEKFSKALDLFAQFFLGPLFTKSATDREINAVDLENSKNLPSDSWRLDQLNKSLSDSSHPYSKFGTGNRETLDTIPKLKGVDIRDELLKFHDQWYSANIMSLAILGKESLDELEEIVGELFNQIKDKNVVAPNWPEFPYPPDLQRVKVYVVPVKDLRSLHVSFSVPDMTEHYKSCPGSYIAHLIGHEGPGSLLSALKAKGWCNRLVGGLHCVSRGFDFFNIQVDLTEQAIKNNIDDIIKLIFQYIHLVNKEGPVKWIHEEQKNISSMNFRFKDKEDPKNYVCSIARNNQKYPAEDVLSAHHLLSEWKPDLVNDLMEYLKPENVRIAIVGKIFEPICDETEKWYGTKYKMEKIPQDCIDSWKNVGLSEDLALPPINDFIPDSFDLQPLESENTEFPRIIRDNQHIRVWHKQDDEFLLPKLITCIQFDSPLVYADPTNCSMTTLFTVLFKDALDEYSYAAELVGTYWSISNTKSGMSLQLIGYNSKQQKLLEKIMEKMVNFQADKSRFEIMKEICARKLRNFKADQPYELGIYHLTLLLMEYSWTKQELLKATEELTYERFCDFIPRLLSSVHVECLIHGNVTKEHSLKIASLVEDYLPKTSPCLLPQQLLPEREIQIDKGSHFRLEAEYDVHLSSCAILYYQSGVQTTLSNVLLELLIQLISEPCYDTLRTKEQLGYIVYSGLRRSNGIQGLRVIVQSDRHPVYVEQRVEAFLHHIRNVIVNYTDEEFEKHRASLIAQRLKKPKQLVGRTLTFWNEIATQEYHFNRLQVEVQALKAITKEQILEFYDETISINSPNRQKLGVHIISQAVGGAGHESYVPKAVEGGDSLLPVPADPLPVNKIEDVLTFKSQRALYPRITPYSNIPRRGAQCKL